MFFQRFYHRALYGVSLLVHLHIIIIYLCIARVLNARFVMNLPQEWNLELEQIGAFL